MSVLPWDAPSPTSIADELRDIEQRHAEAVARINAEHAEKHAAAMRALDDELARELARELALLDQEVQR